MNDLSDFLLEFGYLNPKELALIKSRAEEVFVAKQTKLASASQVTNELWFVKEGVTRVYYYTEKGEEITKYFIDERHFSSDANSFLYKIPMTSYVETVTDCKLIKISRSAFEVYAKEIPSWNELVFKIINRGMHDKVNRISAMLAETGKERYLKFMERYPTILNRIPLNLLASYLGITKYSLSRIRKNIGLAD